MPETAPAGPDPVAPAPAAVSPSTFLQNAVGNILEGKPIEPSTGAAVKSPAPGPAPVAAPPPTSPAANDDLSAHDGERDDGVDVGEVEQSPATQAAPEPAEAPGPAPAPAAGEAPQPAQAITDDDMSAVRDILLKNMDLRGSREVRQWAMDLLGMQRTYAMAPARVMREIAQARHLDPRRVFPELVQAPAAQAAEAAAPQAEAAAPPAPAAQPAAQPAPAAWGADPALQSDLGQISDDLFEDAENAEVGEKELNHSLRTMLRAVRSHEQRLTALSQARMQEAQAQVNSTFVRFAEAAGPDGKKLRPHATAVDVQQAMTGIMAERDRAALAAGQQVVWDEAALDQAYTDAIWRTPRLRDEVAAAHAANRRAAAGAAAPQAAPPPASRPPTAVPPNGRGTPGRVRTNNLRHLTNGIKVPANLKRGQDLAYMLSQQLDPPGVAPSTTPYPGGNTLNG